jgi:histidinol-phosphate/aromatic aminotransferase/cobyric acid decarboxylase-like protein
MKSYLTSKHKNEILLNLGMANNPCGMNPSVKNIKIPDLSKYQTDIYSKIPADLIKKYWKCPNSNSLVIFNMNGSYGVGDEVTRILFKLGFKNLIARPLSFPNVFQWVVRHGQENKYILAKSNDILNPDKSTDGILALKHKEINNNIIYIDCPQNPFGSDSIENVIKVIDHVKKHGGIVFLDVAFGEYILNESRRIVRLVLATGGVVIGTFSKAQGLPGARVGYAIFSKALSKRYRKIMEDDRLLLDLDESGREIVLRLFKNLPSKKTKAEEYANESSKQIRKINKRVDEILKIHGLVTLTHNSSVPIRTVFSTEIKDLKLWFSEKGILTESLTDYASSVPNSSKVNLKKCVRLLLPSSSKIELFTKLLNNEQ